MGSDKIALFSQKPSPILGTMAAEEPRYEVEAILKHRRRHGSLHYYLKWKGYPDSENTWEAEENLNCPVLLAAYWEAHQTPSPKRAVDHSPPPSALLPPLDPIPPPTVSATDTSPLRILAATGKRDGVLLMRVLLANGEQTVMGNDFLKVHFPNLLVRFYEDNIAWLSPPPKGVLG
jgi:hypothetical protein